MPNTPIPAPALRIVVVDDNEDAAESLALLLTLDGHDTRICGNGQQTLQAVATFKPHAVLLDIGLPDLSGHEVAALLRATPAGAALLLIAVTGWGHDSESRSQQAGFDHHLTKPVDPVLLKRLLGPATQRGPH